MTLTNTVDKAGSDIVSTSPSQFTTSPRAGEVWTIAFRVVPFSKQPYEVVTTHTNGGFEMSRTHVGFGEYFSAKAFYRHTIEKMIEVEGVRQQ